MSEPKQKGVFWYFSTAYETQRTKWLQNTLCFALITKIHFHIATTCARRFDYLSGIKKEFDFPIISSLSTYTNKQALDDSNHSRF